MIFGHLCISAVAKVVEDQRVYQANVACHLKIQNNQNKIKLFPFFSLSLIFGVDLLHPSQLSLLLRLCNFEHQVWRDTLKHHLAELSLENVVRFGHPETPSSILILTMWW